MRFESVFCKIKLSRLYFYKNKLFSLLNKNFLQIIILKIEILFCNMKYRCYFCWKIFCMRVVSKKMLIDYYEAYPQAKTALSEWFEKTREANWRSFADVKKSFNSVDNLGNKRYVFNIKGNDFRLVVLIVFTPKTVYIRFVGTHAEYEKIKNIQNL